MVAGFIIIGVILIVGFWLLRRDNNFVNQKLKWLIMDVKLVQEKLEALTSTIEAEKAQVLEGITALKSEIQNLKDGIKNGATEAELQAIADKIDTAAGNVESIYTPETPAPPAAG